MNTLRVAVATALLAFPLAVAAQAKAPPAPAQGYIVGGGLGAVDCPAFVESMGKAKGQKPGATGYAGELQGFAMYVSGFQTAYNLQTPETCDIFSGWNNNQVLEWLDKFCRANPKERFGAGVIALAQDRYPARSTKCG